ncbi:MAG: SDR family oxidoreductase, partial [Bacteroidota bacterium]
MNKLIVVSGATEGIGRAIAEKFIKNGFDLAICARKEQTLLKTKEQLEQMSLGNKVHICQADLSKKEDCQVFIDFINNLNIPVAVLVNNAGFYLPGQIHLEAEGQLEAMINTNLYSAYHLTRGLVNQMISDKKGHIFNICSVASILPYPNGGSYSI